MMIKIMNMLRYFKFNLDCVCLVCLFLFEKMRALQREDLLHQAWSAIGDYYADRCKCGLLEPMFQE